jgi:protoporphyrinogen oxidase
MAGKIIIFGAGPSGLSIAHGLMASGHNVADILVLEKEAVAGGLCRSVDVDGSPLDIGGGHFLDIRRKEVVDFLFRFLPREEWAEYERKATILINGREIDHPLEANIWQLDISDQVEYLEAIAKTGSVRGTPMPESFIDWINWKLGERIADDYMLPYNQKIWSMGLENIGTYWMYKLPDVSFRDTLRSCLEHKPFGALPAHGRFYYPKHYGYGEVWKRMGEALGDSLVLNCPVQSVDLETKTVNGNWKADVIVNTIPWTEWLGVAKLPDQIASTIGRLMNAAIDIDYYPESQESKAHWIYEPKPDTSYHRMLLRNNFIPGAKGYWTETNVKRARPAIGFRYRNDYAYPVNTVGKSDCVDAITSWARGKGIIGAGRWGTWEHMNSDVAVADGLRLAKEIA